MKVGAIAAQSNRNLLRCIGRDWQILLQKSAIVIAR